MPGGRYFDVRIMLEFLDENSIGHTQSSKNVKFATEIFKRLYKLDWNHKSSIY